MPIFDTPEPVYAVVDIAAGRVRVAASDRTDTVVEVRPHNEQREKDVQAAEQTQVSYAEGRLSVKTPKSWLRSLATAGPSVDVDVELPEGSDIDVNAWTNVVCTGRLGDIAVNSAAGDISVERTADARLKASTGDITVGRIDGHGDVDAKTGGVYIDEVAGSAVVKASTGEVRVGEAAGNLRLHGAYGDVRVARVLAGMTAKTAHGSVRVAEAVSGSVDLDSGFGDLEIGVADGTAAWLDVSSRDGVVRSDLAAADTPTTERTVEVRARTQHGDVIVRRA